MNTIQYETPPVPNEFTRCKTGLTVFGIIMIIMGALMGCISIVTPLAAIMMRSLPNPSAQTQFSTQAAVISFVVYAVFSTAFIWAGISSIKARRWIAPVVVAVSSATLYIGIFALVGIAVSVPHMTQIMRAQSSSTAGNTPTWAVAFAAGFSVVFGLLDPRNLSLVLWPSDCATNDRVFRRSKPLD